MIVGSVCSGIAADAVAWGELGWRHAWFAEIAAFPSRVLAHHYPETPNLGDFTTISAPYYGIDLLVGGTPCQSFSVAGLRGGLDDERGQLALEFLRLAARTRPRWIVWENVPGVLSADGGRAFGAFLGGLVELGYGWSYRVLDAQFFGLAQRRKRVFVVACARGAWQRAAAVLLEPESLRGDLAASGAEGADIAGTITTGASSGGGWRIGPDEAAVGHLQVAHTLRAAGFDASEDGTGRGTPLVVGSERTGTLDTSTPQRGGGQALLAPIPFDTTQVTSRENRSRCDPGSPSPSLARGAHAPAIAFHQIQDPISGEISPALGRKSSGMGVGVNSAVRRLTPVECERLMGFPDGYTAIPSAKDGPRYAALGNSIAVPCLRWIGKRIAFVDAIGEKT